ncbi:MAG: cobalamin biosynthesis protein CbiA [Desulfobacterales bacterium]
MNISIEGIVVIVGNYGSGKTEVAINLAAHRRAAGATVRLADLDLVNPYFRTRDARVALTDMGVEMVLPPEAYLHADLPILSPAVAGMLKRPCDLTILDVGGDDAGATVLAALGDAFAGLRYRMLQVVNPFRPFTQDIEGCTKIRREIEAASRLSVNGLVGNANLLDETRPEIIIEGYAFVKDLADRTGLPLEWVTVPDALADELDAGAIGCPLLPIRRQLVPPWTARGRLTATRP